MLETVGRLIGRRAGLAVVAAGLVALAIASVACSNMEEVAEVESCPVFEGSTQPLGGPPAMPYLFDGTYYVDGEPGPSGVQIWVQLARSWSSPSLTGEGGKFLNLIHGPVHDEDFEVPFIFCIGDRDGNSVKSSLTIDYEDMGTFHTLSDLRVDFAQLP